MKSTRFIVFIPLLLMLIACSTAVAEKYINIEGTYNEGVVAEETHWGKVIYKKGEYEFFPSFYTLARSYTKPHSSISIHSSSMKNIYLKNIVMESSESTYKNEIEFERTIVFDKFSEERNAHYANLPLFDGKNTDLSKYWGEGDIKVILNYIDSSGGLDKIVFEFKLWRGRVIVWPT